MTRHMVDVLLAARPARSERGVRAASLVCALFSACGGDAAPMRVHDAGTQAAVVDAMVEEPVDAGEEVPEPPCEELDSGLPTDVFCTGLYLKRDPTQHAPSAAPYTPGVTLWSDGAEKHRYLYLPPGSQIDTSNVDAWRFPVGTKAWKEFRVDGALVETRLLWKRGEGTWESGTYVWDEMGKAATLKTDTKGTILASGYEIPAPRDCDKCHHGGSDKLLGVEAVALALPTAQGMNLASLAAAGFLSHAPDPLHVTLPEDTTGKAAAALGYLHANCGMPCHSDRGLGDETELVLRLRADEFWLAQKSDAGIDGGPTSQNDGGHDSGPAPVPGSVASTDTYRATVGQRPTTASVIQAYPMALRITPGAHDQSLVWLLSHLRGKYQMPPLVSHRVDELATQQLADWIDALRN
jgi:hypothetical protein